MDRFVVPFSFISSADLLEVGGKNASLGEMFNALRSAGVRIPDGYAVTSYAYLDFLRANNLADRLNGYLSQLNSTTLDNLSVVGSQCRSAILQAGLPPSWLESVSAAYTLLGGGELPVAVRSSATAEDLPTASFAGQHDSFLNIRGWERLQHACLRCYASLFNDRAIKYRIDNGFNHSDVHLSIGVQQMVRSDVGSAGVAFTVEPETGHPNIIYITGAFGLGENVVQGSVNPDEFYFFKPSLRNGLSADIYRRKGTKETRMVFAADGVENPLSTERVPAADRSRWVLGDASLTELAEWCLAIEKHYGMPMDIEWAYDGVSREMFIVQARPETVHATSSATLLRSYKLKSSGKILCTGKAVGSSIVTGTVRMVNSLADAPRVNKGDVIVADITNPDWNALLRKAVSIVTNQGGRTSHASIVARELGICAVVGTGNATQVLTEGKTITVSCAHGDEGRVYDGELEYEVAETELTDIPETKTKPMLILADPNRALALSRLPQHGVGLLRMEFVISNHIRIHPMALARFNQLEDGADKDLISALTADYEDKTEYFTDVLARATALVAAAFWPHDVIVRMSDLKTNEYARLVGGSLFEPEEENPMIGFRGASRYYHELYRDAFALECKAMAIVRNKMGLTNVKLMIPFCRTPEEGKLVMKEMEKWDLKRGSNSLEVYVMAELPSNIILAPEFAEIFDGFSIGSNDLTQLTLGLDRDSRLLSDLFDESSPAVLKMIESLILSAHEQGKPVGLCGQAPSDHPEFAGFLVRCGIDSVSFTPDALLKGIANISAAETLYRI